MIAGLGPVDAVAIAILVLAVARGLLRGLIGEVFSLAALGGACVAVRTATPAAADWLARASGAGLGETASLWIAGAGIALVTLVGVVWLGRVLQRGASAAGLGWADRLGGGALGAAEGALVVALGVLATSWVLGTEHPLLADSKSLEAFERLQVALGADDGDLPAVASPPRGR